MIITKNGVELRNLEEQVLENQRLIAKHYNIDRVLGDFGIRIIGTLPYPPTRDGLVGTEYGDAYLVGSGEPPYDVWIWTRPDPNSGHPTDYWLDIGPIAIQGPQGFTGPEGKQGQRGESTKWRTGAGDPGPTIASDKLNDLYLDTNTGHVWQVKEQQDGTLYWTFISIIKGPRGITGQKGDRGPQGIQGVQGPKGDTGDVGGFINIYGTIPDINQGVDPSVLNNRTYAYLVGTKEPYELWVQVGPDSETAKWENMGPLNVSTLVSVGKNDDGSPHYVNLWNADTKVNRLTPESGDRIYYQGGDGVDGYLRMAVSPAANTVAFRTTGGQLRVGTATTDDAAVTFAQHKALLAQLEALTTRVDKLEPSKNLFRCDLANGSDITVSPTTITVLGQQTENQTLKTLRQICPNAVAGRTYTLKLIVESGESDSGDTMSDYDVQMWFGDNYPAWYGNETSTFVMSDTMLNAPVTFYVNGYAGPNGPEYGNFVLKVMMNEGNTLLPWEPPTK